jgi:adenosine deaminase
MTAAVPMIELHCHLEGAAPPDLVRAKADRRGVDLDWLFDDAGGYAWHDFSSFIRAYDGVASVFRDFDDYADLAEAYLAASAADGVVYTELFVSPDHARRTGVGWPAYLHGVAEGIRRAEARHGIVGRIIPLIERHHGPEAAVGAARTAVAESVPEIVGFGMAGDERIGTPADFAPAFRIAHEAGLALTCHAGELCDWTMVRDTLDAFPVRRIGHGVRAVENPDLVRRLADEGIVLEVCPGSNVALAVYPDFASHPFPRLRAAGVRVTLSSDDPPFFHTSMRREYEMAAIHFGMTREDLVSVTRTALDAAFCDDRTKAALARRIDAAA